MARWSDLTPRHRTLLTVAGIASLTLKAAALTDLARRPAAQVRGPKWAWSLGITFVNAFGAEALAYFTLGRTRQDAE